MQKSIRLKDKAVAYQVRRHRRARRVKLSVYPGGRCVVTLPWRVSERAAEAFVLQQADWLLAKLAYFEQFKGTALSKGSRAEYLRLKEAARAFVQSRLAHFNAEGDFAYNKVSIKNQKTCWGSCSKKQNLNFNYRLLLLPAELADYVIVHELCHLKVLNHSPKFWASVAAILPDYQTLRAQLRTRAVA
ncbi:MAG: SprT family zinc-dependent metalloprotease [Candidatus Spechtbacterales bacterium]